MNRFKQCTYTVILLVTCLVASPFIYKQIWNSSAEKKKTESLPPITVNVPTQSAETATTQNGTQNVTNAGAASTDAVPADPDAQSTAATETETAAAVNQFQYVQSDASYFSDALFIGDSRTVGLRDYGTLKNADYFCDVGLAAYKIDSQTVNGNTLAGFLGQKKYGKVYVMLGINEVGNNFDYTVKAYGNLVNTIRQAQPDALIYIVANLHVTAGAQNDAISNERINYLNASLSQFADYKSIFYIDVNPVFDDADGNLRGDATGDGVHVYANYYKTWCDWFCTQTVRK